MIMKIVYEDGSWFVGDRKWWFKLGYESWGTHHFIVIKGTEEFKDLIGKRLAVPVATPKFFIPDFKDEQ